MILSRNWLNKFINLDQIDNKEITQALNSLGFEVEQEINFNDLNDQLIIGYIEESVLVPDTHLRLNQVNIGQKRNLNIICGASNVRAGQYVIVAQIGQKIANGLTLTAKTIRGYQSEGMICALDEIGFNDKVLTIKEADAIYVINSQKKLVELIGQPVSEIGFGDYLWDLDLTLNRSDALAALQLVKELANYFDLKIKNLPHKFANEMFNQKEKLSIVVDPKIKNNLNTLVTETLEVINPLVSLNSEEDLLLKTLGIKSTGFSLEDLSLLSSWESGQPLIVLDQDKIKTELKLTFSLVDNKEVVVLKGDDEIVQVIGLTTIADNFKVSESTTKILVIALNFKPTIMRHQQKALGISNVFLQRYMKPLSTNLYSLGFAFFNGWLKHYQVLMKLNSIKVFQQLETQKNTFEVKWEKIHSLLGINLTFEEIKSLFKTLNFEVKNQKDKLIFVIDPQRTDIYGPNDLCEEIARLYGYDKIQPVAPLILATPRNKELKVNLQEKLENYLIGTGFKNTKTYSLVSQQTASDWNLFHLKNPVNLLSPLSQLHETYRLSLASSLIETAAFNAVNDNKQFKFWEIADLYTMSTRQRHLGLLTTGQLMSEPIVHQVLENNYFYLKGIIEAIFKLYKIDFADVSFSSQEDLTDAVHPFINAEIKIKNKVVGFIFRLNPRFENLQKLPPTCYAELNLDLLNELMNQNYQIVPVSKFQSSTRDLSLIVPEKFSYEKLIRQLLKNVNNVFEFKIIDQYQDSEMQTKKEQSLTLSFIFNDLNQQLTEKDVNQQWEQILNNVKAMGLVVR